MGLSKYHLDEVEVGVVDGGEGSDAITGDEIVIRGFGDPGAEGVDCGGERLGEAQVKGSQHGVPGQQHKMATA